MNDKHPARSVQRAIDTLNAELAFQWGTMGTESVVIIREHGFAYRSFNGNEVPESLSDADLLARVAPQATQEGNS